MKKWIIRESDENVKGIIGIVTQLCDYPPYTNLFEVTDLNGNTESGYQVGDKFDVMDGEFGEYYPPHMSTLDILREKVESLLKERARMEQRIDEDATIIDRIAFIEIDILKMRMEIEQVEKEEERKQNEDNNKDKDKSELFTTEMFKEMFKVLLKSNEIQFITDEVKTYEERSFRTKVLIDGEEVYEHKEYVGEI